MALATTPWPWLAVAAAGALHGLNPVAGWGIVAWRARAEGKPKLLRALLPIVAGNVAAVVIVAAAVPLALALGLSFDPLVAQGAAAALLLAVVVRHVRGHAHGADRAGLALWSFIVATAHGAGWMLVPAFVPLCATGMPGREIAMSGSVLLVLAAVGVHLLAMLLAAAAATAVVQSSRILLREMTSE